MENHSEIAFIELIAAGMLLAFVLAASIVFFVLIYKRKLAIHVMSIQKMKLNHQEVLIQSNIQVSEYERKQFSTNLHDVIGAQIAIAKITLSSVEDTVEVNQKTVSQTMEMLDGISNSIRSISYNIMPPVLIKLGLPKAIQDYLRKLPGSTIQTQFISRIEDKRYHSDIELHAFRILQEAITNAIKHAKCTSISIDLLTSGKDFFELVISDNGVGVNGGNSMGTGFLNMEHRANLMDFKLDVVSNTTGTVISLKPKPIDQ